MPLVIVTDHLRLPSPLQCPECEKETYCSSSCLQKASCYHGVLCPKRSPLFQQFEQHACASDTDMFLLAGMYRSLRIVKTRSQSIRGGTWGFTRRERL